MTTRKFLPRLEVMGGADSQLLAPTKSCIITTANLNENSIYRVATLEIDELREACYGHPTRRHTVHCARADQRV